MREVTTLPILDQHGCEKDRLFVRRTLGQRALDVKTAALWTKRTRPWLSEGHPGFWDAVFGTAERFFAAPSCYLMGELD